MVKVGENVWQWMKMDDNGWKWIKVDESGWNGGKWMKMDESGWKQMTIDESGLNGEMDENGWNGIWLIYDRYMADADEWPLPVTQGVTHFGLYPRRCRCVKKIRG